MEYLSHIIRAEGVSPDPTKVEAIRSWPEPKNAHEVRVFLGLANYYARMVKGYASIAAPLHSLLKKGVQFIWDASCSESFRQLKAELARAPVLAHADQSCPFIVECDASDVGIGATLTQPHLHGRPICYYSRKLTTTEQNYSVSDRELLAIKESCLKWRCYLANGL